jgi:hypothetical protein
LLKCLKYDLYSSYLFLLLLFKINIKQSNTPIETKSRIENKIAEKKPYVTFIFLFNFILFNYSSSSSTYLELGKDPSSTVDYTQIVKQNQKTSHLKSKTNPQKERENSTDFIDNPDVPPLI